jgi:hypothetical protein
MKIVGGIGGAFLSIAYVATKITFVENTPAADTIVDTNGQFLIKGFMPGMTITITETADNNKTVTIATVTATIITLIATDDLTDEPEGTATLTSATKGAQVLGMKNISIDDGIDVEDSTCYEDYPYETHEVGFKTWTANIDGFWLTDVPKSHWLGKELVFMLFLRTAASPSAGDPAVYYQGSGIVQGLPVDVPTRQLVKQTINIIGDGQLTLTVKTDAW